MVTLYNWIQQNHLKIDQLNVFDQNLQYQNFDICIKKKEDFDFYIQNDNFFIEMQPNSSFTSSYACS